MFRYICRPKIQRTILQIICIVNKYLNIQIYSNIVAHCTSVVKSEFSDPVGLKFFLDFLASFSGFPANICYSCYYRCKFVTLASKSDSKVTKRLREEFPSLPFFRFSLQNYFQSICWSLYCRK